MFYYFYSEKEGLKGLINHRLVKKALCENQEKAVEYARKNCGVSIDKPVGYIYKCRQLQGEFFNNAYKTEHPLEIVGCVSVKKFFER